MNSLLARIAAARPNLTVWDFATAIDDRSWFATDNEHLNAAGAQALASWLSAEAERWSTGDLSSPG